MYLLNKKVGRIVVLYIWVTYLCYLFLTFSSQASDLEEIYTIVFLFFVTLAFYLGCLSTPIKIKEKGLVFKEKPIINATLFRIFVSVIIVIELLYIGDLINSGLATLSFSMGENYANRLIEGEYVNSLWGRFYVLLSPFRILLLTYGVFVYTSFRIIDKLLVWLLAVVMAAYSVFLGVMVGIGDLIIYILVPLFIRMVNKSETDKAKRVFLLLSICFVGVFIVNQMARSSAFDVEWEEYSNSVPILLRVFGPKIGPGISRFVSYFSHGYRGLNYSLQLPFEWTNGYGGSRAFDEYVHQYLHFPSMFDRTYPMRVLNTFGYDCQKSWPTAFAWWASDFSFPGVVVLMFFIGRFSCLVLRDAYYHSNLVSLALLAVVAIMLVFLPLNNQVLQSRESFVTTVALFSFWVVTRHSPRHRCCV